MIAKWRDGFDVVYGRARSEEGNLVQKATAALFHRSPALPGRVDIPLDTADFRLPKPALPRGRSRDSGKHRLLRGMTRAGSASARRRSPTCASRGARARRSTRCARWPTLAWDGVRASASSPAARDRAGLGFDGARPPLVRAGHDPGRSFGAPRSTHRRDPAAIFFCRRSAAPGDRHPRRVPRARVRAGEGQTALRRRVHAGPPTRPERASPRSDPARRSPDPVAPRGAGHRLGLGTSFPSRSSVTTDAPVRAAECRPRRVRLPDQRAAAAEVHPDDLDALRGCHELCSGDRCSSSVSM